MANCLGIDCGATNLRIGIIDDQGNLLKNWKVRSPLKSNPQSLAEVVKGILGDERFNGIGVGIPGPLDLEKGLILPSSNLGNKEPLEIKTQFESVFASEIQLDRDTVVALLGEQWKGGAEGLQNVVMLTIGTGVGGAVLVNGEVDRGESGKAGEIGHMYIKSEEGRVMSDESPRCGLGHEGCLEAWVNSAKNLDELGEYLGIGLANIVDIFNPEKIIIGGGKVQIGDFLTKAVEVMKDKGMKPAVDEVSIGYAKLGEWSGVYGAAKLAYDYNQNA